MGCSNSKSSKDEAPLRLCRERRRFIKQAIDSRYALAASHVSYVECLRGLGVSLRRYAEAESDKTTSRSLNDSPLAAPANVVPTDEFPLPPPDSWDFFAGDDDTTAEEAQWEEKEDPSEFITHRAKDFLSSINDIEHRFFRASESGKEVARMLEANKISVVGYSQPRGRSSALAFLQALQLVCCRRDGRLVSHEPAGQGAAKVITWKRTASSRSSSSRNPLAKDDGNDSGSDFVEEFCMIAGSHSSTLDRLYAWERKLYDEVKASESIRKEYDQKCEQLRYMFAKDYSSHAIDKTRAVVKDLHSRIRIAIQSVDSISKRIEKMRDEELHPQLVELAQGLIRMWKSMLECHHAQYITISLAYHSKSTAGTPRGQVMEELLQEVECFGLSFADWINSLSSYVEALNFWLHNSILPPRERSKRRPFSPHRYLGPPIFTLIRDWTAGIRALPSDELTAAIRAFLSELHRMTEQQEEAQGKTVEVKSRESEENKGEGNDNETRNGVDSSLSNLSCIQATLTKVLDRLTKFSEESLKMYEDLKQKNEAARAAYSNSRSRF